MQKFRLGFWCNLILQQCKEEQEEYRMKVATGNYSLSDCEISTTSKKRRIKQSEYFSDEEEEEEEVEKLW